MICNRARFGEARRRERSEANPLNSLSLQRKGKFCSGDESVLLKQSTNLSLNTNENSSSSGDRIFKVFLLIAVMGCVWGTAINPHFSSIQSWLVEFFA
ncbi:MAG: hypothetical protein ACI9DC_003290 [Gammaproteobacteria bacterium]|jgi:hypothetical protein